MTSVPPGLDALAARHAARFRWQSCSFDLLPPSDVDLAALRQSRVEPVEGKVTNTRRDIGMQLIDLTQRFAGQSDLLWLNAACISFLRRKSDFTDKARHLFRRMWAEETAFLLAQIDTRWLISSLQTFYDHGASGGERTAGAVGFMYGNFIKIYEGERDACRPVRTPESSARYRKGLRILPGIGGFKPGDDILANMNVLAYDVALKGGLAGPLLLELLDRARKGNTIFSRTDALRHQPAFRDRPDFTLSFGGKDLFTPPAPGPDSPADPQTTPADSKTPPAGAAPRRP